MDEMVWTRRILGRFLNQRPATHSPHPTHVTAAAVEEEEDVMETDGGEAGKRTRAGDDTAGAGAGATAGRAAAARQEGKDNLQFEDAFEGRRLRACIWMGHG